MTIDIGNSNNGIPVGDVSPAQGGTAGLDVEVVTELPQTGEEGILYLVPVEDASGATNTFKEYIWLSDEDRYEELGYTDFDATGLENRVTALETLIDGGNA